MSFQDNHFYESSHPHTPNNAHNLYKITNHPHLASPKNFSDKLPSLGRRYTKAFITKATDLHIEC